MALSMEQMSESGPPERRRILVADDQDMLRSIIRAVSSRRGYEVVEARDGEDPVAKHGEEGASFDLVLLDVQMPGLGGREAWKRIMKADPAARVLFLSGGLQGNDDGDNWLEKVEFLQKPFDNRELLNKVQELLGG